LQKTERKKYDQAEQESDLFLNSHFSPPWDSRFAWKEKEIDGDLQQSSQTGWDNGILPLYVKMNFFRSPWSPRYDWISGTRQMAILNFSENRHGSRTWPGSIPT
jgi:hypothetical protein